MADCIGNLFEIASNTDYEDIVDTTEQLMEKTPVIGNTFEDVNIDGNMVLVKYPFSEDLKVSKDEAIKRLSTSFNIKYE